MQLGAPTALAVDADALTQGDLDGDGDADLVVRSDAGELQQALSNSERARRIEVPRSDSEPAIRVRQRPEQQLPSSKPLGTFPEETRTKTE